MTGKPDIKNGKGAPGRGQLYIDGKLVGQVDIPLTMPLSLGLGGGFVCGADSGSPVWDKYKPPFKFTGTLYGVDRGRERRADQGRRAGPEGHHDAAVSESRTGRASSY